MSPQHPAVRQILSVLLLAGPGMPATTDAAVPAPVCASSVVSHESRQVRCSVPAGAEPARFRLQVSFSGGHDDTIASIAAPEIDGAPLACDPGSKTRLVGEDGDVSVDCIVSLQGSTTARQFVATVKWTHAEYTGVALTSF